MDETSKEEFSKISDPDTSLEAFCEVLKCSIRDKEYHSPETSQQSVFHHLNVFLLCILHVFYKQVVYMITDVSSASLDIKSCIRSLVTHSEGRSYRDIGLFIQNVQLHVLGTQRYGFYMFQRSSEL